MEALRAPLSLFFGVKYLSLRFWIFLDVRIFSKAKSGVFIEVEG